MSKSLHTPEQPLGLFIIKNTSENQAVTYGFKHMLKHLLKKTTLSGRCKI